MRSPEGAWPLDQEVPRDINRQLGNLGEASWARAELATQAALVADLQLPASELVEVHGPTDTECAGGEPALALGVPPGGPQAA